MYLNRQFWHSIVLHLCGQIFVLICCAMLELLPFSTFCHILMLFLLKSSHLKQVDQLEPNLVCPWMFLRVLCIEVMWLFWSVKKRPMLLKTEHRGQFEVSCINEKPLGLAKIFNGVKVFSMMGSISCIEFWRAPWLCDRDWQFSSQYYLPLTKDVSPKIWVNIFQYFYVLFIFYLYLIPFYIMNVAIVHYFIILISCIYLVKFSCLSVAPCWSYCPFFSLEILGHILTKIWTQTGQNLATKWLWIYMRKTAVWLLGSIFKNGGHVFRRIKNSQFSLIQKIVRNSHTKFGCTCSWSSSIWEEDAKWWQ